MSLYFSLMFLISAIIYNPPICNIPFKNFSEVNINAKPMIITSFKMFRPDINASPTDSTIIFVWRFKNGLLFKFINYTKNTEAIKKTVIMRDVDINRVDDYVAILIASEDNPTEVYVLMVNPVGTQKDLIAINKGYSGVDWDGNWRAKSIMFEKGWETLIFIPYSDLPSSSKSEWRINFMRKDRSLSPPELYVLFIPPSGNLYDLTEAPILKMENVFGHTKRLFLNPYIRGKIVEDGRGNGNIDKKIGGNLELETKRRNAKILLSVFPDFNFIEADADHIVFDEYGYYLPEKRPFFLMKQEFYNNGLFRTIYTRKIESFDYGSNMYGSIADKYEANAFLIKRTVNNDSIENRYWDYLAILRYKKAMYNLQFNFTGETNINSKTSISCYDIISEIYLPFVITFVQLSKYKDKLARAIKFVRSNNRKGYYISYMYKHVPYGFDPPLGYLLTPHNSYGFKQTMGYVAYTKYVHFPLIKTMKPSFAFKNETDEQNKLIKRLFISSLQLAGKKGIWEYHVGLQLTWEDKLDTDNHKLYHNYMQGGGISLRHENGKYNVSFSMNRGRYQESSLFYPSVSAYFKPIERMGVTFYAAQLRRAGLSATKLVYSRLRWSINEASNISTFLQWSSNYNELLFNLIFQYRVNSRTYLYISLSELHRLTAEDIRNSTIGLIMKGIAIKVTYRFGII